MNRLLTELGVPQDLQALFNNTDCLFEFGDAQEHFGRGFHRVPTSQNVWRAAPDHVTDVIVTHSAMEAIAYITLNRFLHPIIENIAFIALGNFPHSLQMNWIRETFKKRKITLVFGNCLLGTLTDIRVVAGLRLLPLRMELRGNSIVLQCKRLTYAVQQEKLSVHVFEKAFGIRSGIRTSKPKNHLTYLDQLITHGKY